MTPWRRSTTSSTAAASSSPTRHPQAVTELRLFLVFLFAWVFFQSLWVSKLARRVDELSEQLQALQLRSKD